MPSDVPGDHAVTAATWFRIHSPASDTIALGCYVRDGRSILLLVNVGQEAYTGQLVAKQPCSWYRTRLGSVLSPRH